VIVVFLLATVSMRVRMSVRVIVFAIGVVRMLVPTIFVSVGMFVAMRMSVPMIVVMVVTAVVDRNCRPGPGQFPHRDGADQSHCQENNPPEQNRDKEHRRENAPNHASLVHQHGDEADTAARKNREQLIEEKIPRGLAVRM
jgi:hypothetical protein